jgi:hypothetical protein
MDLWEIWWVGKSMKRINLICDKGSILILTAFLLVAIMGFTAIVIDIQIASNSQAKLRRTAEYVALGALEAFLSEPANIENPNAKLDGALERAKTISGIPENFMLAKAFLEDKTDTQDLLCLINNDPGCEGDANKNGSLVAGRWHFVGPDRNNNGIYCEVGEYTQDILSPDCPCVGGVGSGEGWYGAACFEPFSNPSDPNNPPNAFRVNLQTKSDSHIKTLFASVIGHETLSVRASATASVVPRHAMFLVDLSPSIHEDTHLTNRLIPPPDVDDLDSFYADNSESAFLLDSRTTCRPRLDCSAEYSCRVSNLDTLFNRYMEGPRDLSEEYPPTKHFRSDYQCARAPVYRENGVVVRNEQYLLDTYRNINPIDPNNFYDGPEPLTSILAGINEALAEFENRAVSGDLVGIIGFDETTDIVAMNPNQILRNFPLISPGSPGFNMMKELTDVTNPDYNALTEQIKHLFIPRPGKWTNIPMAILEAQNQLGQAPGAETAESFVVLFSDGMGNATLENFGSGGPANDTICTYDLRATPNCNTASNPNHRATWDEATFHWVSMKHNFTFLVNELNRLSFTNNPIIRSYKDQNIAFNVFLFGNSVAPHTLLLANGEGECLTDLQARKNGFSFVDIGVTGCAPYYHNPESSNPSWFDNDCRNTHVRGQYLNYINGTSPFTYANTLYYATVLTNGFWAPIRPACSAPLSLTCDGEFGKPLSNYIEYNTDPEETAVDNRGRLLCDPDGLSKREQVRRYISEIMSQNPFVIVQ